MEYLIMLVLVMSIYSLGEIKKIRFLRKMGIFLIIIFSGIRYDVGIDYLGYKNMYEVGYSSKLEIGYKLLINILKKINLPYYSLFFMSALITYVFIYLILEQMNGHQKIIMLFLILTNGFLFSSFNVIRKTMASSIFFYGIIISQNKKWNLFSLSSLIFHYSYIYSYMLLILKKLNFSRIIKYMMLIISFFIYNKGIISSLIYKIPIGLFGKYSYYIKNSVFSPDKDLKLGSVFWLKIIFIILIIFFEKKFTKNDKFFSEMMNFYIVSFCANMMLLDMSYVARIISNYFILLECYIYTKILFSSYLWNNRKLLITIIIFIFSLIYWKVAFFSDVREKVKYRTIFSKNI